MLRNIKDLRGLELVATDHVVGRADDFYFDDQHWTVRYLVARTGSWLKRHQVLLSPMAIERADWDSGRIHLKLTQAQVEASPDIDFDRPIALQQEVAYHEHFGWAGYWGFGAGVWGPFGLPGMLAREPYREPVHPAAQAETELAEERHADPHLRSCKEVLGYHLQATDGELGHIDDFLVDDESWTFHYLAVDTKNWVHGKRVLVSPRWVERVSWAHRKVFVALGRDAIRSGPEWDPALPITRSYEMKLHDHYARAGYWEPHEGITRKRPEQSQADEDAAVRPYPTDHDSPPGMF
jgi:uncharacterized protein YrrD